MIGVLKSIQDDLYILLEYSFKQYKLQNSDALKNSRINIQNNIFVLLYPDYLDYINSGRRKGAKLPPFDAILKWCRQKGLPTDNKTIWRIRQGIKRDGIKARPVLDLFYDLIDKRWENEWSEDIFNYIIKELENWFK